MRKSPVKRAVRPAGQKNAVQEPEHGDRASRSMVNEPDERYRNDEGAEDGFPFAFEKAVVDAVREATERAARDAQDIPVSEIKNVRLGSAELVAQASEVREAMAAMHARLAAGGVLYLGVTKPVALPKANWDVLPQALAEATPSLLLVKGATADRVLAATPAGPSSMEEAIGSFYDTAGLTKWLGVTRQALDGRVRTLTLLACVTASGQRVYPSWQFDANGNPIPGLSSVLRALAAGIDDPWTWALWLSAPTLDDPEMGDAISSWQWLARGYDLEPVLFEARADSARWAS